MSSIHNRINFKQIIGVLLGVCLMNTALVSYAQTITVATEPAFEPFEYMQNNKVVGYGPALLDAITEGSDYDYHRENVPFSSVLPGLLARKYDLVATTLTISPDRAKKVAFTRPIAAVSWVVLTRADDRSIANINDLSQKNVGAQRNSTASKHLGLISEKLRSEQGEGFKSLSDYTDYPELKLALMTGRIDAFIAPMPMAKLLTSKDPKQLKIAFIDESAGKILLAWALRPDEVELREFINQRIAELKASGQLDKLQMQWLGSIYDTPKENYLPAEAL